jgi:hypothetical protein
MNPYQKGAAWRIWDLQIQTILDDGYKSLATYYEPLKGLDAEKWGSFVSRVGGESNALLYDSKAYFGNDTIPKKERCVNHVSTVFAFLEIYKPHLGLLVLQITIIMTKCCWMNSLQKRKMQHVRYCVVLKLMLAVFICWFISPHLHIVKQPFQKV